MIEDAREDDRRDGRLMGYNQTKGCSLSHFIGGNSPYHFLLFTFFAFGGVGRWDMNTGSLEQLRQSIKMLNDLELKDLYPGHGPAAYGNASEHAVMARESLETYEEF